MPHKLTRYFASASYPTVGHVLAHVDQISREMQAAKQSKPSKPAKPVSLSPFSQLVIKIAPKHLDGQYNNLAIRDEIVALHGPQSGDVLKRVEYTVSRLTKQGHLPRSSRADKPLRLKKLREATPEAIKANIPLINRALSGRWWRGLVDETEARGIALRCLTRAIETHDETRSPFDSHVARWIRGGLFRAVKTASMQRKRLVSMDQPKSDSDERTLHDKIGTTAVDPEAFESDIERLVRSRAAKPHYIAIYALRAYGHEWTEMARFFNVTRQSVWLTYLKALKILNRGKTQ